MRTVAFSAQLSSGHVSFSGAFPLRDLMNPPDAGQPGRPFYYLYQGVELGVYPPLIFLGIGALTDFGPLIS